ncbi:lytic transglycosylase domain-containing protein [Youngiibacter multivorans]|uniref:Soluble lytic murein transglycosylase n=1 Tax=Youngiibacter multivorans TaxID=937251 RepID=A0ABS4G1H9_9CLOT|nr:lytic transglycosylase domain-containing protein [Youngiibacter multivorans]MBP1918390.1 soluble lytic murein transglycosylase [Youngiibacter multivorans]
MKKRIRKKRRGAAFSLAIILIVAFAWYAGTVVFPIRYFDYIEKYSLETGVDKVLILSVIHAESGFDPEAVSAADARGLMQINESTGKFISQKLGMEDYTQEKLYDPETSIRMGTWYLSYLGGLFSAERTALAAYNAGPGRVREWIASPDTGDGENLLQIPYAETSSYVKKIELRKKIYRLLYFWKL